MENILRNINEGILELVGYKVLPSFIGYRVSRITDNERKIILKDYLKYLHKI